jgi:histidine triad (HIT) family protein
MDIHPAKEGYCLVIPRWHIGTIFEIDPDIFAAVGRTVVKIAAAVQRAIRPPGLSLVKANGMAAGQTVMHLHVHVLPRCPTMGC